MIRRERETDEERAARYAALENSQPTLSETQYSRRQFFSMLTGVSAGLSGLGVWRWVQEQPADNRIPQILRDTHEFNEGLWRRLFREGHLAPTFDRSESSMMRVNGRHGLDGDVNPFTWRLDVQVEGRSVAAFTIDDIQALPKQELTVEHKCVEGWSHIVTWGGARWSDFHQLVLDSVGDAIPDVEYIALATPDAEYFVGMDMPTMLHPQTLLAWELQGEPLTSAHGAPLRLATPLKYGIKQIKRIGTIDYTDTRPDDYWFRRGYDWYAHL